MHRPEKRRLLITATLWLAAISPLAAASPRPEASPPPPGSLYLYPERFALEDGSLAVGERGLLFVPVKRSDPQSGVLSVEVYRFSAKEGVPADAPPIFVLQGGPGFEGLERRLEQPGFFERNSRPRTAWSEVVVVGQRSNTPRASATRSAGSSRPATSTRCRSGSSCRR